MSLATQNYRFLLQHSIARNSTQVILQITTHYECSKIMPTLILQNFKFFKLVLLELNLKIYLIDLIEYSKRVFKLDVYTTSSRIRYASEENTNKL